MTGMDINLIITYSNEGILTTLPTKFTLRPEQLAGSSAYHEQIHGGFGGYTGGKPGPPPARTIVTKSGIRFRFIFATDRILQFNVSSCVFLWVEGFLLLVSEEYYLYIFVFLNNNTT